MNEKDSVLARPWMSYIFIAIRKVGIWSSKVGIIDWIKGFKNHCWTSNKICHWVAFLSDSYQDSMLITVSCLVDRQSDRKKLRDRNRVWLKVIGRVWEDWLLLVSIVLVWWRGLDSRIWRSFYVIIHSRWRAMFIILYALPLMHLVDII